MILRDHSDVPADSTDGVAPSLQPERSLLGATASIICIFEAMESDFSKNLVELTLAEGESESGYQKLAQQNNLSEVSPEREMEFKC